MVPRSCAIGETHVKDGRNGTDAPSDKLFLGEAEPSPRRRCSGNRLLEEHTHISRVGDSARARASAFTASRSLRGSRMLRAADLGSIPNRSGLNPERSCSVNSAVATNRSAAASPRRDGTFSRQRALIGWSLHGLTAVARPRTA